MNEHIIVVDDNKALCKIIAEQLEEKYGERYDIDRFYDARDVVEFILDEIDCVGDHLVMVASDERMEGMQGHELMIELTRTHPRTKKIIFSAWSDVEALKSGINTGIDRFANKTGQDHVGDEFFEMIDSLLKEYEMDPKISFTVNGITIKQVETLYEKCLYLSKRFEIYQQAGYFENYHLSSEKIEREMEWDDWDLGEGDRMVLSHQIRYLLALKGGECVGGLRIIDGAIPLETGICQTDGSEFNLKETFTIGSQFNLDKFRGEEAYVREVSRLVVDEKFRKGRAVVLIGLFKMLDYVTGEHNNLLCTSSMKQIGFYQAIGCKVIGPLLRFYDGIETIPMIWNRWEFINNPDCISGLSQYFRRIIMNSILPSESDKWAEISISLNEEAIKRGFYEI